MCLGSYDRKVGYTKSGYGMSLEAGAQKCMGHGEWGLS